MIFFNSVCFIALLIVDEVVFFLSMHCSWYLAYVFYLKKKNRLWSHPSSFSHRRCVACDYLLMKLTRHCSTGGVSSSQSVPDLPPPLLPSLLPTCFPLLVGRAAGHVALDLRIMIYYLIKSSSGPDAQRGAGDEGEKIKCESLLWLCFL